MTEDDRIFHTDRTPYAKAPVTPSRRIGELAFEAPWTAWASGMTPAFAYAWVFTSEDSRQHLAGDNVPRAVDFEERIPRHPSERLVKRPLRTRYRRKTGRRVWNPVRVTLPARIIHELFAALASGNRHDDLASSSPDRECGRRRHHRP